MSVGQTFAAETAPRGADAHTPILRWLIFTGATIFAVALLQHYGLLRLMLVSDRTYISTVIIVLYIIASLHCLWRTAATSRQAAAASTAEARISAGAVDFAADGALEACRSRLPQSFVADHIADLVVKAEEQRQGRVDQSLLLRVLAERLRGSNGIGAFASDSLMKLGLLGTIVGFIIMLAPIAGLDAGDRTLMKSSMGMMSDGMAVAMYTTLAGLVGSVLLKIQYYALEAATTRIFVRAVRLTETRVVPALDRRHAR